MRKSVISQSIFLAIILATGFALGGCKKAPQVTPARWQPLPGLYSGQINVLAVTRLSGDQVIYAGTEGGMYKSTDKGARWLPCHQGLSNRLVRVFALDPDRPNIIYVGTRGGRIYKSSDSGDHWQDISQGLSGTDIVSLVVDPNEPDIIHAATPRQVYTTGNGGQTWRVSSLLPGSEITFLTLDSENPYIVYVGTREGILHLSPDRATSWLAPIKVAPDLEKLCTVPGRGDLMYAIAGGKVYRSEDRSHTWSYNDNYLDKARACALAVQPRNSKEVLVGTTQGIYKSRDGRQTWYSTQGLPTAPITALAYDPVEPEIVYAGLNRSVYRSTDQGESWAITGRIEEELGASILALLPHPQDPLILYASAGGGGLYRTTDGGQSWQLLSGLPSAWITALGCATKDPTTLYAGSLEGKAYRSTDGGVTWVDSGIGLPGIAIRTLAVDPEQPTDVYLGTWGDGVYLTQSWDHGWKKVTLETRYVSKVLIDTRAGRRSIYALGSEGTYRGSYDDRGVLTWRWYLGPVSDLVIGLGSETEIIVASHLSRTQLEGAAANPEVAVIQSARQEPGGEIRLLAQGAALRAALYAVVEGGGIQCTNDLGKTWESLGEGLEKRRIRALVIHPGNQALYVGTDRGVFHLP